MRTTTTVYSMSLQNWNKSCNQENVKMCTHLQRTSMHRPLLRRKLMIKNQTQIQHLHHYDDTNEIEICPKPLA